MGGDSIRITTPMTIQPRYIPQAGLEAELPLIQRDPQANTNKNLICIGILIFYKPLKLRR